MMQEWKNYLLNLSDRSFFDLMRVYLGELKTPFNKHDLVRSLTSMMMGTDVQQRLFSMIDDDDRRLLSSVRLLGRSTLSELHSFTGRFYSFLELHNRIENLQQRLLLCVDHDEKHSFVQLNPMFEERLVKDFIDPSLAFPTLNEKEETSGAPWLTQQLLSAFISFLLNNDQIYNTNKARRRKAQRKFDEIFSAFSGKLPADTNFSTLLFKLTLHLGLITETSTGYSLKIKAAEELGKLSADERLLKINAAAACILTKKGFSQADADGLYLILKALFASFSRHSRIGAGDLEAAVFLLKHSSPRTAASPVSENLINALCSLGLLYNDGGELGFLYEYGNGDSGRTPADGGDEIRIQSNFEIIAPPDLPIEKEIYIAACSEITGCDLTRNYIMTKRSLAAALDLGITLDELKPKLTGISRGGIPQNVLFSMNAWSKEHGSISLNYGIVMTIDSSRLPLIEHSPGLKRWFTANPAPGVFILNPDEEAEWRKDFADAGFDILPPVKNAASEASLRHPAGRKTVFPAADRELNPLEIGGNRSEKAAAYADDSVFAGFDEKIEKLKISEPVRESLKAMNRKKLIVADSQLKSPSHPGEKGEAGGLDHQAKIRLAERAIELENLLEITTAVDLELERTLVKPFRLLKTPAVAEGRPPVYRIEGVELPDEKEYLISISRISRMKMLKSSLYTP